MKNKGKQQRPRDTIKTTLGAAAQVLIDHGYEKATTIRIAECAGHSVGTLYQYFDDKEDIYGELIDQALAEMHRFFCRLLCGDRVLILLCAASEHQPHLKT